MLEGTNLIPPYWSLLLFSLYFELQLELAAATYVMYSFITVIGNYDRGKNTYTVYLIWLWDNYVCFKLTYFFRQNYNIYRSKAIYILEINQMNICNINETDEEIQIIFKIFIFLLKHILRKNVKIKVNCKMLKTLFYPIILRYFTIILASYVFELNESFNTE